MENFVWQDIICCYSYFGKLIIDDRSKNKDSVAELAKKYRIKKVIVSTYYFQANEMIERVVNWLSMYIQRYLLSNLLPEFEICL